MSDFFLKPLDGDAETGIGLAILFIFNLPILDSQFNLLYPGYKI
ncbi:hypothetical protein [Helicobacter sp. 11S03491-1]|nr:hypothetical protein [Helicobacter sp. 11S03491-1]